MRRERSFRRIYISAPFRIKFSSPSLSFFLFLVRKLVCFAFLISSEQLIARISHSLRNPEGHLFARLFRSLFPRDLSCVFGFLAHTLFIFLLLLFTTFSSKSMIDFSSTKVTIFMYSYIITLISCSLKAKQDIYALTYGIYS